MFRQKPITDYIEIVKRCLDNFWGKTGWDKGSPAHKWTLNWSRNNFTILKRLQWKQIYKKYKQCLVQE